MDDYKQVLRDALALHQGGRFDEAMTRYRAVLAQMPDEPNATYLLGVALHQASRFDDAVTFLTRACAQRPDFPDAFNNLGEALRAARQYDAAREALVKALALRPDEPAYLANLSHVLLALNDAPGAAATAQKAIDRAPNLAPAYLALGNADLENGEIAGARAAFERALRLNPEFEDCHVNLAMLEAKYGDPARAVALFEMLPERRRVGIQSYARAAAQIGASDYAQRIRRVTLTDGEAVPNLKRNSGMLFHANYDVEHPEGLFELHKLWGAFFEGALIPATPRARPPAGGPMRIGFVSNDFKRHSCAHFLLPLFAGFDPERVAIIGYSDVKKPDAITDRLREFAAEWHETRELDDGALARKIAGEAIDVLVDLGGHTAGNRLGVFARKPCAVQVSWLGYANTTGLTRIDWRFTDPVADPPGQEKVHTEKLWRLDGGFLRFAPLTDVPAPVRTRADGGRAIRFGSFNAVEKISASCWDSWVAILQALPEATLSLKAFALKDRAMAAAWRARAAAAGVGDRVRFMPFVDDPAAHLALYGEIDVALDTAPYGGTTTSCEALWQGVPLVTMAGQRHASRVGASLLAHIRDAGIVAKDWAEYRAAAIGLGQDPGKLAALARDLAARVRTGRLCDGASLAREMTDAFAQMSARR